MAVLGKISLGSKLGSTSSTLEHIDMNLQINVDKHLFFFVFYLLSHLLLVHLPLGHSLERSLAVGALDTRHGAGLGSDHP